MATLSGSLHTLALPEILRLVASTAKNGLLHVESSDVVGRLYFVDGELTYATTRSDLGFTDSDDPERRIVDVDRITEDQTAELMRQQVTDVLVRLMTLDQGSFSFEDGDLATSDSGVRFDVEAVLKAAAERIREWERIKEVLPSVGTTVRLSPQIDTDDVTLDARSWAVIAALGSGGSVTSVAQDLKVFEFAVARKLADLIRRGLVTVVDSVWEDLPREGLEPEAYEPSGVEEEPAARDITLVETRVGSRASDQASERDSSGEDSEREPPASDLARRWRELSSSRQRGDG